MTKLINFTDVNPITNKETFLINKEINKIIKKINNIELEKNEFIFHAGTYQKGAKIYSNGGRVLNFVSLSNEFKDCRKNLTRLIDKLNWSNGFYRKDIGYKVIDQ